MKKAIWDVIYKYKILFREDIGHANEPRFMVKAEICEEGSFLSSDRSPCYFDRYPKHVMDQLIEKLNKSLANGVLKRVCTEEGRYNSRLTLVHFIALKTWKFAK